MRILVCAWCRGMVRVEEVSEEDAKNGSVGYLTVKNGRAVCSPKCFAKYNCAVDMIESRLEEEEENEDEG
ncbi:hypothetical protein [Marininema halotolerans]|uniref:Uncharacterized protein n=1 Tax=Marininema halotolerans TaxID=1155944 RepID=A0A1I6Q4N4_9BACL|nr:hypothetical protein [Marininema halotolerans]SFS47354.1 hypothetical protein SAMN05444972_102337 [Marininema halotolerans]